MYLRKTNQIHLFVFRNFFQHSTKCCMDNLQVYGNRIKLIRSIIAGNFPKSGKSWYPVSQYAF